MIPLAHLVVLLPVFPPPNAINAGTLPTARPPHQARTGGTKHSLHAAVAISAALPRSGLHGGAEWPTVPIPSIKSCRDLAALLQDRTLADGRVLLSHSLEVLSDKDARERLYPGRLLRVVATRRTRYSRVTISFVHFECQVQKFNLSLDPPSPVGRWRRHRLRLGRDLLHPSSPITTKDRLQRKKTFLVTPSNRLSLLDFPQLNAWCRSPWRRRQLALGEASNG